MRAPSLRAVGIANRPEIGRDVSRAKWATALGRKNRNARRQTKKAGIAPEMGPSNDAAPQPVQGEKRTYRHFAPFGQERGDF